MLTYSFYESDNRVRRYAETLVKKGNSVDVISLRTEGQTKHGQLNGVSVYRIQQRARDEKGKFTYLAKILKFFVKSALFLSWRQIGHRYDLIHVHSVPDFEVFAAFCPRQFGAKLILDIHDPVPDLFSAKFGYKHDSTYFKVLKLIERYSAIYADHVITVTDYWRDTIRARSNIPTEKISAIVNYPDTDLFNYNAGSQKIRDTDKDFIILYPGTLNKHCGVDIVINAISLLRDTIPNIRLHIYGSGGELPLLQSLTTALNLEDFVSFNEPVPIDEVPALMLKADLGIALLAGTNAYSKQALNVKLFEFLAMGLPAIATRVDSIERYLGEEVVMLSNQNDPVDVARCINELYCNPQKRAELKEAGLKYIQRNCWKTQIDAYVKIIEKVSLNNIMAGSSISRVTKRN